ncbi:unnamed protein product [Allacma fusca]|uniref:WAPL domain-containing protein n=1 Tax=Allacma fusca TaxID=39272 RepID=A0A8J2LJD2_9HEXA|nr:unnamed protein product [Allacma fusca]
MSRYSKSYGRGKSHGGAGLKFDTLLKACSNSKKPSANRTAGALGRFGIASFTSTRNSNISSSGEEESRFKFTNKRPKLSDPVVVNSSTSNSFHMSNSQNNSFLQAPSYSVSPITPVYKPRKFFKSRDPVSAQEPPVVKESSIVNSVRPLPNVIAPLKIPIPKSRLNESPEKTSKPLRNANNTSPPNSQPIKLRIFKDKATSKLVSVSEAPPPILEVEHEIHKTKSEKIPKKRGRKPKNLASKEIVTKVYEPAPEKKPSGRLTRNSRKHEKDTDQEQQEHHSHFHLHRNSDSSVEAMPILMRAHSRESEENIGRENSDFPQNIFKDAGISGKTDLASSSSVNPAIEKKLEDDAEFQQLSQILSSMEDEEESDYSNLEYQQNHQNVHLPALVPHQPTLAQHESVQQQPLEPTPHPPLHEHFQPQAAEPQEPLQHVQYNSQSYTEYPHDTAGMVRIPAVETNAEENLLVPTLDANPPTKVRDTQDIRAILEDDWDESFDEESPKKSPPKTSRFDLSAFMHDGTPSSSSPTSQSFSPPPVYGGMPFQNTIPNAQSIGAPTDAISGVGYSQYQHQHPLSHPGQFVDTPQQHLTQPFNAPYAVRNLLSSSGEYQTQMHVTSSFSQDPSSRVPVNAHESTKENLKESLLDQDKSAEVLNLSVTPTVTPTSSHSNTHANSLGGTKKGSIFKSRALKQNSGDVAGEGSQGNPKKRLALYKHKFGQGDGDEDPKMAQDSVRTGDASNNYPDEFDEDSDPEDLASMRRVAEAGSDGLKVVCRKSTKKLYSVIRNVKPIHELQESGEFHEFDGDVWYIIEELKDKNLMTNRCLSAITLATRCMEPAFRMHLRAHGTVAEFCKELHDAPSNPILALLASAVLFVLSQDRLNMDLDTDSLKLIIALTKACESSNTEDESLEILKLRQRVFDLVQEMKNRGHAKHLKVEKITASELALETLLYLTSKRAGEWVKHELRTLGGLDYIVTEVVTSLQWLRQELAGEGFSEGVIERLWKIDRCLRVLQQVTFNHEENQRYLLGVSEANSSSSDNEKLDGTPEIFIALFRFCNDQLSSISTDSEPAKVLREILFSVLRVLVNLSHDYRGIVLGSEILCRIEGFLPLCLHSVFHMPVNIPDEKIFDLLMHSLCMLLNLVEYSKDNRNAILSSSVKRAGAVLNSSWSSDDSGVEEDQPTLDALVEMFVAKERAAKKEEASTDDILTKGTDSQKDSQKNSSNSSQNSQNSQNSQDNESSNSVQDTIDKLIQTAGKHMENSLIAAYVSLLLAYLIMDNPVAAETVRNSMPSNKYLPLMIVLKKLFNFMSITSSASGSLRGLKATAIALKFYAKCDPHSNEELKKIIPD